MYVCIYIYIYIHTCMCMSSPFPNTAPCANGVGLPQLNISGKAPMGSRIPPLTIKIMFESNHLKSTINLSTEIGRTWVGRGVEVHL